MTSMDGFTPSAATAPRRADACTVVIFGASGDLTRRKLLPALYNLTYGRLLAGEFAIIGIDRQPITTEEFRQKIGEEIRRFAAGDIDAAVWESLVTKLHYLPGDFLELDSYMKLQALLPQVEQQHYTQGNVLYYLATPPRFFGKIVQQLGSAGLIRQDGDSWRRVVVEKPFGRDLRSARALNQELRGVLAEDQIYRIDHYLGKETVQNILVFRFANGIFEPVWNKDWIDNVQITVAECVGVEGRGGYYDRAGALRDMVENHMFQLMDLIAMEPPSQCDADSVRDKKRELISSVRRFQPDEIGNLVVRGQYTAGTIHGKSVPAYRSEPSVAPDSTTETFVALKVMIDSDRWQAVPFYLRTGKCLPERVSEIAIQFKRSPYSTFTNESAKGLTPNTLVLRIQPDEGIDLQFGAKIPGPVTSLDMVDMNFRYTDYFGIERSNGYETLLYDSMIGDATLFPREDNLEITWSIVDPILEVWSRQPADAVSLYPAGSWGPKEAETLIEQDGRKWRRIRT